ncbi:MAG: hypothetical protein AAFP10_07940 [Pseudomonadota bacterium]
MSDEELARTEKMIRVENNDKMADQQRLMVWVSLISVILFIAVLLTPWVSIERVNALIAFGSTWVVANMGIIGAFIASNAWIKSREQKTN